MVIYILHNWKYSATNSNSCLTTLACSREEIAVNNDSLVGIIKEAAQIDSGLNFEEFEAMHADAPEPDYDGRGDDGKLDADDYEPEFDLETDVAGDEQTKEDKEQEREREVDYGLGL